MNLKKIALATALAIGGGTASADPIYLDLLADVDGAFLGGDGDSVTDIFQTFTLNVFSPTSNYFDDDGTAGVSTGDTVIDIGQTEVGSLNPVIIGGNDEGYGAWGINVDYQLLGVAIVGGGDTNGVIDGEVGETLGGQFNTGTIRFTMFDPNNVTSIADGTELLVFGNLTSEIIAGGAGLSFDLNGDVTMALEDFVIHVPTGEDINDLLEDGVVVKGFADNELDAETFPVLAAADADAVTLYELLIGSAAGIDTYTRTTEISSLNAEITVPEPATVALLGLGMLGFGRAVKRRQQS